MANYLYPLKSQDYVQSNNTLPTFPWIAYHGTTIPQGKYRWFICRFKNTAGKKIKITEASIGMTSAHCAAFNEYGEDKPMIVDWIVGDSASSYVKNNDSVTSVTYFDSNFSATNLGNHTVLKNLSVIVEKNAYFYVGARLHSTDTSGGIVVQRVGTSFTKASGNFFLTNNPQSQAPKLNDEWFANSYWDDTVTDAGTGHVVNCFVQWVDAKVDVSSLTVSPSSRTIEKGSWYRLSSKISPTNATLQDISWSSSNAATAEVNAYANVHALLNGKVTITGTVDGKSDTCSVTVVTTATGIVVPGTLTLEASATSGNLIGNQASLTPSGANVNTALTWSSSNEAVATVSSSGNIKAIKNGTANITAKISGASAKCVVTVRTTATSLSVPSQMTMIKGTQSGSNLGGNLTFVPASSNANTTVTWASSDSEIATIDTSGNVTAIKNGTVQITATISGAVASCSLAVRTPVSGITIEESDSILYTVSGENTVTYNASVVPQDASEQGIVWSSSNSSIVSINSSGEATGVSAGIANVYATSVDGGFVARRTVTVRNYASSLTIDNKITSINRQFSNTSYTFYATAHGNPYDKTIYWSTSDSAVISVANGVITAIKAGSAVITAKAAASASSFVSDSVTVQVVQLAQGISASFSEQSIKSGERAAFTFSLLPSDVTKKTVQFVVDGKKLKDVNSSTKTVLTDEAGVAALKVATEDGTNLEASCNILVKIPEWANTNQGIKQIKKAWVFDGNKILFIRKKFYFDADTSSVIQVKKS